MKNIIVLAGILILLVICGSLGATETDVTVSWDKPDSTSDWAGLMIRINGNDDNLIDISDPGLVTWVGVVTLKLGENVFEMLAYDPSGQRSEWSDPAYYVLSEGPPGAPTNIQIRIGREL